MESGCSNRHRSLKSSVKYAHRDNGCQRFHSACAQRDVGDDVSCEAGLRQDPVGVVPDLVGEHTSGVSFRTCHTRASVSMYTSCVVYIAVSLLWSGRGGVDRKGQWAGRGSGQEGTVRAGRGGVDRKGQWAGRDRCG